MTKFTIPLAPVTKKNSMQISVNQYTGKPVVRQSEKYIQYEHNASYFIPKNAFYDTPVNVKCTFYMPTHRKCDLTNLLEAIDDIMVKCGLLKDDNYTILTAHDFSRVKYDKENPRTEVEICEMEFWGD